MDKRVVFNNMNYRKMSFVLMTMSFVLIMSGSVSSFVIGLREDAEKTNKRMVEVKDVYDVFDNNISVFESTRDNLYTVVFSDIFYDTMYQTDSNTKNQLSNYENLLDELEKNTKKLDNLCGNVYYPDSDINTKCVNYKNIYEQAVNYFVSDIKVYNGNVEKYNKYQKELNSLLKIEKYKTKRDYIDYNNDSKYEGREE